jgi:hypothetical protein
VAPWRFPRRDRSNVRRALAFAARRAPLEDRTFLVLRGHAPADLVNVRQRHPYPTQPFERAEFPPPPKLRPTSDWPRARLNTNSKSSSPTARGGRASRNFRRLARDCSMTKYAATGARSYGRASSASPTSRLSDPVSGGPTNDVRAALAEFLEGKDEWPNCREFRAAGRYRRRAARAMGERVRRQP